MYYPSFIRRRLAIYPFLVFSWLVLGYNWRSTITTVRFYVPIPITAGFGGYSGEKEPFMNTNHEDNMSAASSISREAFIEAATILPPFNPSAIQQECSKTTWQPDVVFRCRSVAGGATNVRQEILTCIKWAIGCGAGMIIPSISIRTDSNITGEILNRYGAEVNLDLLFNREKFLERLRRACPQMPLFDNLTQIDQHGQIKDIGTLSVKSLLIERKLSRGNLVPQDSIGTWGRKWINDHTPSSPTSKIRLVNFRRALAYSDICDCGPSYADAFGRLLVFRDDARRLAGAVLYELKTQFNLSIGFKNTIPSNAFLGVHLRTESDAVAYDWTDYTTQEHTYLGLATPYNLPISYVASGNLSSVSLFAAASKQTPVATKLSLLANNALAHDDLVLLRSMTWDQQAVVDYLVLSRSSRFLGLRDSSFSYNLAITRRSWLVGGICGRESNRPPLPDGIVYTDELSVLIGAQDFGRFRKGLWP